MIGVLQLPGQQQDPVMFEGAAHEAGLPEQPARPVGGAEGEGYDNGQHAAHFLETVNQTRDGDHFSELGGWRGGGVAVKWRIHWHPEQNKKKG